MIDSNVSSQPHTTHETTHNTTQHFLVEEARDMGDEGVTLLDAAEAWLRALAAACPALRAHVDELEYLAQEQAR